MTLPTLDTYLTTAPEAAQDALTADDDLGCRDCGHTPCDCDERCYGCGERYRSAVEQNMGICCECRQDQLEAQKDDAA